MTHIGHRFLDKRSLWYGVKNQEINGMKKQRSIIW